MADDLMDSRQTDQEDDESDEYPPDEAETKRIEEVSEHLRFSWLRHSSTLFPSMRTRTPRRLFADGRWRNENEEG